MDDDDRKNANIEKLKAVEPIEAYELRELHTGSLLTRLKSLRSLHGSYKDSDWTPEERHSAEAAGLIIFKDTDAWRRAFSDVKAVLSEREHIPRGSKEQRQEAAHLKKNR